MTAIDYESQVLTEEFEEATRILARSTESIRLELIDGKVRSRVMPDGDHGHIMEWLTRSCLRSRPELWLCPARGLQVPRAGRAAPVRTACSRRVKPSSARANGQTPRRS